MCLGFGSTDIQEDFLFLLPVLNAQNLPHHLCSTSACLLVCIFFNILLLFGGTLLTSSVLVKLQEECCSKNPTGISRQECGIPAPGA